MNMQERMIDKRTFRIAAIAVAAAAVLVLAAYLFGTGLRADTSASVAPSPLGSSLTDVRAARAVAPSALGANSLDTRGARTIVSAERAASLAALAKSRSDFYADLNAAAAASRWAAIAAGDEELLVFYNAVNATNAAADLYQNEWMGFTAPESVRPSSAAAGSASVGNIAPAAVPAMTLAGSHYARLGSLTAAESASVGNIAPAAATLAASHYARLGSLTAAEAAGLGNIAPAASRFADRYDRMNSPSAVDQYQFEWMGVTSPESVGASSTSSAAAKSAAFHDSSADFYGKPNTSFAAAKSASPAAVGMSLPAGFHDSSADFYGKPNTSSMADPYQNEWMGFTAPESVGAKLSATRALAADPSPSIKPEGINPSAAVDSAAKQVPWMKPEGIKASGAK